MCRPTLGKGKQGVCYHVVISLMFFPANFANVHEPLMMPGEHFGTDLLNIQVRQGSVTANTRQPKSCLGRDFNFKRDSFGVVQYEHGRCLKQVTAINFILLSNSKFKCEFKFTKYLRGTKYLFAIYQTSRIRKPINQKIFELDRI